MDVQNPFLPSGNTAIFAARDGGTLKPQRYASLCVGQALSSAAQIIAAADT
jgi:hypothetical protein